MTNLHAYRPYWHPVAHCDEVADQPMQVNLLGERIVIFRSGEEVIALKDLCIHRGAELSAGRVVDGNVECPYHGWQYGKGGSCVRIPSLPDSQPIPSKARTDAYDCREHYGLIWVALEEAKLPLPTPPEEWDWQPFDGRMRTIIRPTLEWKTSAGRWAENALDVSHFAFVHGGLLGASDDTLITPYEVDVTESTINYRYDQVQPGDPGSFGSGHVKLHYHFVAPFTLFLRRETPTGTVSVFFANGSPVEAKRMKLLGFASRDYDVEPEKDKIFLDFLKVAMEQDKGVIETIHPEEIPTDLREELHIMTPDAAGIALRRMYGKIESAYRPKVATAAA